MTEAKKWWVESYHSLVILFQLHAALVFLAVGTWPALCVMQWAKEYFFISYPLGAYSHLAGVSSTFPVTLMGIVGIPFSDAPNSFFIPLWLLLMAVLLSTAHTEYKALPKKSRQGETRQYWLGKLVKKHIKFLLVFNFLFTLVCLPGIRSYQIVTDADIRTLGYFCLNEDVYPLGQLIGIERYVYGVASGHVAWKLSFDDQRELDVTGPNSEVMKRLIALDHVSSNVVLRNGRLYQKN